MADALTPQNVLAAPVAAAPGVPALELDQIQGDVLIGLQKFFERFLFFEIKDVAGFKGGAPAADPALDHHQPDRPAPRVPVTRP